MLEGILRRKKTHLKHFGDYPGGPVVKNLPSNAGDTGSIPGWGTKIPLAAGQLSPCAATTQSMHFGARVLPRKIPCATRPNATNNINKYREGHVTQIKEVENTL